MRLVDRMVDHKLGLKLPLHIHALVQDSDDRHCTIFNAIEDQMLSNRMAEIPFPDVIAIPADTNILCDQVEGLI